MRMLARNEMSEKVPGQGLRRDRATLVWTVDRLLNCFLVLVHKEGHSIKGQAGVFPATKWCQNGTWMANWQELIFSTHKRGAMGKKVFVFARSEFGWIRLAEKRRETAILLDVPSMPQWWDNSWLSYLRQKGVHGANTLP